MITPWNAYLYYKNAEKGFGMMDSYNFKEIENG